MVKAAFLFPGQGAQAVGMGRELFDRYPTARAIFAEADAVLGFPLSATIFDGPESTLAETEFTQPAILTVSVAALRVLTEALDGSGIAPSFAAGHSLGEYGACIAAGAISFAEAVRTVHLRGQYMQRAVPAGQGAMAAILGLGADEVNDCCAAVSDELAVAPAIDPTPTELGRVVRRAARAIVAPANLNTPEQTVISGSAEAVDRAIERCEAAGARKTMKLNVSAPFHCALMQPAQEELAGALEAVTFVDPLLPVVCNVDARAVTRRADVRDCLIRQVTAPVRWVECVQWLVGSGVTHLVELGPGRVLTGLTRGILGRGVDTPVSLNVEDEASLTKTVAALRAAGGGDA